MNDYIAFLTSWAADIRASSGAASVDADCLESIAHTLENLGADNASKAAQIARLEALNSNVVTGVSLRAYIATKVIGGLCANPSIFQANDRSGWDLVNCTEGQLAECAVRIADEMIISLKAGA